MKHKDGWLGLITSVTICVIICSNATQSIPAIYASFYGFIGGIFLGGILWKSG